MSNTSLLGSYGGLGNSGLQFRNKIINGDFDIWQRGTSQTSSGYGSDDRWTNVHVGSTKTHSRQSFTLGQTDVPGNPQFFSRTVVSSVAGNGNLVAKIQRIEGVQTLAGQTATLSFWAKADAAKNIAIDFSQIFGTGGSPSAAISGIGVTTIALTTSWKYYTVAVSVPSIAGKTIGTNGDDFIECVFWFDAGSTYAARTNSLGNQSGTFDIAQIQMEAGPVATPFEHRPIGLELDLCQRYYEHIPAALYLTYTQTAASDTRSSSYAFKQEKRAVPSVTISGNSEYIAQGAYGLNFTPTLLTASRSFFWVLGPNVASGVFVLGYNGTGIAVSAEL